MRKLFTVIAPAALALALSACAGHNTYSVDERTVHFESGKHALSSEARAKLDSLASSIKDGGNVESVTITGFADRRGSDKANEALSQRRANAVKQYLGGKGVNGHLGNTGWVGETQSTTPCDKDTSACLAPDRKVEVTVNYTPRIINSGTNNLRNHEELTSRGGWRLK